MNKKDCFRNLSFKRSLFACIITIFFGILVQVAGAVNNNLEMGGGEKVIDRYEFGSIFVKGENYDDGDIIIFSDRIKHPLTILKDDHLLTPEDLEEIISTNMTTLIVGTGQFGNVIVPEKTLEFLQSKGIKTYIEKTQDAVDLYNKSKKEKLVALLHLNC